METECDPCLHQRTHKRLPKLKDQLKKYTREDPATMPQLAVPVTITEAALRHDNNTSHRNRRNARVEVIGDLVCIAFYYLLQVGEYTNPYGKNDKSRPTLTKPFRVSDITFRNAQGRLIPNSASLPTLLTAVEATMRIPNQKNGVKGQCIHNECTGNEFSPVKCLARRVHHIMSREGNQDMEIYKYKHPTRNQWHYISPTQINAEIKQQAKAIGLYNLGYTPNDVSSHSLRAGGAMAMHLNKIDILTIRKMGRWKSDTFLCYIHDQISAFAAGVSTQMSNDIPFRHISGGRLDGTLALAPAA